MVVVVALVNFMLGKLSVFGDDPTSFFIIVSEVIGEADKVVIAISGFCGGCRGPCGELSGPKTELDVSFI